MKKQDRNMRAPLFITIWEKNNITRKVIVSRNDIL